MVCKTDQPLDEIDAINERDEGLEWSTHYKGGWQVGQYSGTHIVDDAPRLLADLATATRSPTLTGFVLDSDCVDVQGYGHESGHFTACLDRECMAFYLRASGDSDIETAYLRPDEAAAQSAVWAAGAGVLPDTDALHVLFATARCDPIADELFFDLLSALGLSSTKADNVEPERKR